MCTASCWIGTVAVALSGSTVNAQAVTPRATTPGVIEGIVLDTTGQPIAEADVFLRQLQTRTRSRRDGTFSFVGLKTGKYDITARSLGYLSRNYRVTVGDSGGGVTIRMERAPFALPSVITSADRNGLSGVIADTAFKAMAGVEISVLGTGRHVTTDSAGSFYLDVNPGNYMVSIKRDGYARQNVGVTVPMTGGRKIAAWMIPQSKSASARETQNLMEMSQRIMRVKPVWSKFYAREDMEKMGATVLRQVASVGAQQLLNQDCPVIVNGGPHIVPLWELDVSELEFVEVHSTPNKAPRVASIMSGGVSNGGASTSMVGSSPCVATIYAWLRR